MFCSKCGNKLSAENEYCSRCGSAVTVKESSPTFVGSDSVGAVDVDSVREDDLRRTYANLGELGKADMRKKHPHVDFSLPITTYRAEPMSGSSPVGAYVGLPVLASGSGKKNPHCDTVWICTLLCAAVEIALFTWLAFLFQDVTWTVWGGVTQEFGTASYIFILCGIGSAMWMVILGSVLVGRASGTIITVTESNVIGSVIDGSASLITILLLSGFGLNKTNLAAINLTFDQISSVDVEKDAVIIHASGAKYKCFAQNGTEIQNAILNQQRNQRQV